MNRHEVLIAQLDSLVVFLAAAREVAWFEVDEVHAFGIAARELSQALWDEARHRHNVQAG